MANRETVMDTVGAMMAVRDELGKTLRAMGVTAELKEASTQPAPRKKGKTGELRGPAPAPEMEALLKDAANTKVKPEEMDAFWDQAAQQHANKTTNPEVIPYEQARKMGLTPDKK